MRLWCGRTRGVVIVCLPRLILNDFGSRREVELRPRAHRNDNGIYRLRRVPRTAPGARSDRLDPSLGVGNGGPGRCAIGHVHYCA
jgi:hypothetical protein